jgi:hypothetical protein
MSILPQRRKFARFVQLLDAPLKVIVGRAQLIDADLRFTELHRIDFEKENRLI